MIDWYGKLYAVVRWNDTESASFHITSDVRQGCVLSPIMFKCFINDLILTLTSSDLGCHTQDQYIGCIFYADDILLLSASMNMLQDMLNVCYSVSNDLFISSNYSKSYCIMTGPPINYTSELEAPLQ